jgi:translation initiation factor IF-2
MADSFKPIRLSKAAREYNVGIHTIVEYLQKKGVEISSSPNTKLTPEMYELLELEFSAQKTVKQESQKIGLEYKDHETITISDAVTEDKAKTKDAEFESDIFIKDQSISTDKSPVVEVEKTPEPEVTKAQEVVVEKKKDKAETEKVSEPEKVKEEIPPAKEDLITDEPEIVEEIVKEEEKPKPEEKEIKETEQEIIVEEKEPEVIPEKEEDQDGIKVVGKIDLTSINEKMKPARKSKEEKKKERAKKKKPAEKPTAEKEIEKEIKKEIKEEVVIEPAVEEKQEVVSPPEPEVEEKKEEAPVDKDFIKTKFEKLTGPKILDKIDITGFAKKPEKKPVASSKDDQLSNRKKRRKRIVKKAGPVVTDKNQKTSPADQSKGTKPPRDNKRVSRRDRTRPEVSEEDIQKQIKETLAKLTGGGKSKASKYRREKRQTVSDQKQKEIEKQAEDQMIIKVTEFVTANELAVMMNVEVNQIISTCMSLGLFVSINQRLDAETLTLVADEFGYKVEFVSVDVQEAIGEFSEEDTPEDTEDRIPVVTVMGHVDHGKTKLLDYVRSANVVAGEAGGITQHIGAYEVTLENGKKITFLDTPGHEAFTAMRARGAKVTDLAIIVIAADDNVMPQTKEAINHAQAAGVPIIFAINKIDKPTANPDKIKDELSQMNILVEDWGGKFQSQEISAINGQGIDVLLEKVLLEAEMLELKANSDRLAVGTIIESSLDKGRGYVTKLLVQNGTLKIGDMVIAGSAYGKVKAMYDERNRLVKKAGPSVPVLMLGLSGAPGAGDGFNVMRDEREAKAIANKRQQLQREQGIRTQKHITLDEIGRRLAIGDFKELNIIVKGDVDGSVEALSDSLLKLTNSQVQVNIIHKSVGAVTESDVMLASASDAIIVAFQVRPSVTARRLAESEQIDIRLYSIIYKAIEEIQAAIEGMLTPDIEEKIVCNVEIREIFKITKVGTIAGCMVLDGTITRNTKIRIIRDGIVVYTGSLGSLKRFKDDVKEVKFGYECGLNIENFNDIKVGDIVEGYEEVEVKRKL